jgi:hypothetical protein
MATLNLKLYMKYAISPAEGAAERVSALLHQGETHRDNCMIVNTMVRMTVLGLEAKKGMRIMTANSMCTWYILT